MRRAVVGPRRANHVWASWRCLAPQSHPMAQDPHANTHDILEPEGGAPYGSACGGPWAGGPRSVPIPPPHVKMACFFFRRGVHWHWGGGTHRGPVARGAKGLLLPPGYRPGLPKIYLGVGEGRAWSPCSNPPTPPEGAPRAGSLFSIFVMHISNHWFLISHSKTALPLVGAIR